MVLTKTDQKFIEEHGVKIMGKMKEYRALAGKRREPFNYELGYANMREWYDALPEEIESLKNLKRTD